MILAIWKTPSPWRPRWRESKGRRTKPTGKTNKKKRRLLRVERRITRLGGNFSKTKQLDEKAMARTMEALACFSDLLSGEGVEKVWGVAKIGRASCRERV